MNRILAFAYGVVAYLVFFATFCYLAGFVGNLFVSKSIDSGPSAGGWKALALDLFLIVLFGLHHSVTARPAFKRWWARFVPKPIERSTYVLISSLLLILLFWKWQPLPAVIWNTQGTWLAPLLGSLYGLGWVLVLASSFMINHFDLFGLRQVTLYFQRKEYTPVPFKVTGLYHYLRHPLMLGFLIAFWIGPVMTVGRLVFAAAMTAYIFIGIYFEERNIGEFLGEPYLKYRRMTSMIFPGKRK